MKRLDLPQGIIIHHSATRDTQSISYDAIARHHTETNGWDDIGYHYIIEVAGDNPRVFTGRGLQYHGAHCRGKNDHIGICIVGNYDNGLEKKGKLGVLITLLKSLLVLFPHLKPSDIHYHREFSRTTCPGVKFPRKDALMMVLTGQV